MIQTPNPEPNPLNPDLNPDSISLSEQDKAFIQKIAQRILDSGLVTPAVFFLEMTKPLALVGSHALIFFGPIINAFINTQNYYRATEIFEKPEHVEYLLTEIERLDRKK